MYLILSLFGAGDKGIDISELYSTKGNWPNIFCPKVWETFQNFLDL